MSSSQDIKGDNASIQERIGTNFWNKLMYFIFNTLDQEVPTTLGVIYNFLISFVILFLIFLLILQNEPTLGATGDIVIFTFEAICTLIIFLDYITRLYTSYYALQFTQNLKKIPPFLRRAHYFFRFWNLFDLLTVTLQIYYISFYVSKFIIKKDNLIVVEVLIYLRIFRLIRLLSSQRSYGGFGVIRRVLKSKWRELLFSAILLISITLLFSFIMFTTESTEQPENFGSVPRILYFSVSTISTTGFGDFVPKTWWGKAIVTTVVLLPISLFGIPIAVIAAGIIEDSERANKENDKIIEIQNGKIKKRLQGIIKNFDFTQMKEEDIIKRDKREKEKEAKEKAKIQYANEEKEGERKRKELKEKEIKEIDKQLEEEKKKQIEKNEIIFIEPKEEKIEEKIEEKTEEKEITQDEKKEKVTEVENNNQEKEEKDVKEEEKDEVEKASNEEEKAPNEVEKGDTEKKAISEIKKKLRFLKESPTESIVENSPVVKKVTFEKQTSDQEINLDKKDLDSKDISKLLNSIKTNIDKMDKEKISIEFLDHIIEFFKEYEKIKLFQIKSCKKCQKEFQ